MQVAGVDRLAALNTAIEAVRRGGTISLSGVYGGATDEMLAAASAESEAELIAEAMAAGDTAELPL